MKIYKEESSVAHLISDKTNACLNLSVFIPENQSSYVERARANSLKIKNKNILKVLAKLEEYDHPDLMYGSAILVSTVMNKNDDVFLAEETWAARKTPINTPYNQEHEEQDIIGHIIDSRVLDQSGKEISVEGSVPPDYFDIEVDFVVYQSIFPAIAKSIAENAPQKKQFVSMECVFSNFDYAIFEQDGTANVIKRDAKTSFLSKYLRSYGGSGVYNGKRIGRVLRDIRFVGMGNVKEPANPASEYTKIDKYELASASVLDKDKSFIFKSKGDTMVIENLEKAKELIDGLTKELEDSKAKIQELTTEKEALVEAKNTSEATLTAKVEGLETATATLEKANKELEETKALLETTKQELAAKAKEIADFNLAQQTAVRIATLKELGLDNEEETKTMCALSDELFASMVAAMKKMKEKCSVAVEETVADKRAEEVEKVEASKDTQDIAETNGDEPNPGAEAAKVKEIAEKLVASVRKAKPVKSILKNKKV